MEVGGESQRSLHSISLEASLLAPTTISPTSGDGSGESVKTPVRTHHPKDGSLSADRKPPSYLGISCAVSGYSHLNRYDSALREGFRSRDNSPARLAFSRSRDSSPMRPDWPRPYDSKISPQATALKIRELKDQLAKCARDLSGDVQRTTRHGSARRRDAKLPTGRSKSVDRGYLSKAQPPSPLDMNGHSITQHIRLLDIKPDGMCKIKSSTSMHNYSFQQSMSRDKDYPNSLRHHSTNNNNYDDEQDSKSFIQQRIERLYGPGALGSAFRSRRSLLEKQKQHLQHIKDRMGHSDEGRIIPIVRQNSSDEDETVPEGMPSVFRHLRPEFRHQLPVKQQSRTKRGGSFDSPSPDSPKASSSHVDKLTSPVATLSYENGNGADSEINVNGDSFIKDSHKNGRTSPDVISLSSLSDSVNREMLVPVKISNDKLNNSNADIPTTKEVKDAPLKLKTDNETNKDPIEPCVKDNNTSLPTPDVNTTVNESIAAASSQTNQTKDGHYYLKVVDKEVKYIEEKVKEIEQDMENTGSGMTEDVRGKVLAATGKAKLLVSQKIQQFAGLCHKNIAGSQGEEFPTTNDDLAGFWDMVSIQVSDVHSLLQEVNALRSNGWKEVKSEVASSKTATASKTPRPKISTTKAPKQKTAAMKAKDEARKKMIEERRKAMKEAKKAEADIQIDVFVPNEK